MSGPTPVEPLSRLQQPAGETGEREVAEAVRVRPVDLGAGGVDPAGELA
jgi:hypothetical protein